jgi:hypothetical protein
MPFIDWRNHEVPLHVQPTMIGQDMLFEEASSLLLHIYPNGEISDEMTQKVLRVLRIGGLELLKDLINQSMGCYFRMDTLLASDVPKPAEASGAMDISPSDPVQDVINPAEEPLAKRFCEDVLDIIPYDPVQDVSNPAEEPTAKRFCEDFLDIIPYDPVQDVSNPAEEPLAKRFCEDF